MVAVVLVIKEYIKTVGKAKCSCTGINKPKRKKDRKHNRKAKKFLN